MSDTNLPTFRAATEEAPLLRIALIGIAVAGLAILVFAPLAVVFAEALKDGWLAAVASLANRDARSAIHLTLLITAIAVPANAAFGIAAAWFITKFDFRGKAFLITLIDLPFSVSPVVAGLCIVLLFGANSAIGGWLVANGWPIVFAIPGIVLATVFVTFPFVARELIPVMIEQGRAEEEVALTLGACAALSPRDPLNVQVAGIQPLQGEGLEARFLVKLRLQNPNEGAIDYSGVALDLEVNGRRLASGVSDQRGTVPRFGESVLEVPVTISAFSAARQALGLAEHIAMPITLVLLPAVPGVVTLVFQHGWLSGFLGFMRGPLDMSMPVLLFCIAFGLSVDFELFLIGRMKELWEQTGSNRMAVVEGLAHTGRINTLAALVLSVTFAAFGTSQVSFMQLFGLGAAMKLYPLFFFGAIFVLALLFLGLFLFIMKRTRLGLEVRAVTQNPGMAASMGINPDRIAMMTFGLGSGIAGIAGVAIGLFQALTSVQEMAGPSARWNTSPQES